MMNRRTFLFSSVAFAAGAARTQPPRLETLSQWMKASRAERAAAIAGCLERIKMIDGDIQAWVQVSPQRPTGDGPLAEIPFGAKDIVETRGLATEYGSPIYKGRIGENDAAIIRALRGRGAVLLGKTHTTAFAYRTPAPTRNPRNPAHTPGGSSSGSAAAVAAGMVPFAIGTQTGGSMLRPAAFCGVTGFKPTYGLLPMEGVFAFAKSLDTLGFFTHTAADMLQLWEALGYPSGRAEETAFAAPDPLPELEPVMTATFRETLMRLKRGGVDIRPVDIAAWLTELGNAQRVVMFYEGARHHDERFKQYGDRLQDMATLVREGRQITEARYNDARRFIADARRTAAEHYKTTPIILVPSAPGPAPRGLSSTGDSRMNTPWSALGTPAISIPMPVGDALPLGLQLTANVGDDARVLRAAVRIERALATN